eukprot:g1088.t1
MWLTLLAYSPVWTCSCCSFIFFLIPIFFFSQLPFTPYTSDSKRKLTGNVVRARTMHSIVRSAFNAWILGTREAAKSLATSTGGKKEVFSVGWDQSLPHQNQVTPSPYAEPMPMTAVGTSNLSNTVTQGSLWLEVQSNNNFSEWNEAMESSNFPDFPCYQLHEDMRRFWHYAEQLRAGAKAELQRPGSYVLRPPVPNSLPATD